ncbi:Protease Do-like 2, chloroplastic [Asimina triloba]
MMVGLDFPLIIKVGPEQGGTTNSLWDCKDKYLVFEFEDNFLAVLERKSAVAACPGILKDYGIPSERSPDLVVPCVDSFEENQTMDDKDFGEPPVAHLEIGCDGLIWA